MQGREGGQRELLDVESFAGHLLPAGSVFAFLAEHRGRLFPDELFEDLFPSGRGRPSVPVSVIASALVLQALHNVSDREAVEVLTFDLRWKAACGFAIDQAAFHPSTFTYWRRRLAASRRPERIFEAVSEVVASALVGDALALLEALDVEAIDSAGGVEAEAVALLALVAGQDVEPAEGSDGLDGRWRIARQVTPERVISTVDPEARHAHKTRHARRDGFTAHVDVEPETGIFTQVAVTKAAGDGNSDAAVGIRMIAGDPTITRGASDLDSAAPVEVLGDTAYGTGAMLAALDAAGLTAVIKPWPIKPPIPGGFTIDDFTVDEAAGSATCPQGLTRPISPTRKVTFGAACTGCPLRDQCTTAINGRKLQLHDHDALQRAHRVRATDPTFQDTYRSLRPMVERSIAWLTRGARRVPYRGVAKNNTWLHHRAAGLNLRRLLNLGLAWSSTGWVTA